MTFLSSRLLAALVLLAVAAALIIAPGSARAAQSYDNCTGFIDSLPATISTQGTWCLRKNLGTSITSGSAITIFANNVTIDCNDFKIGGLAAGAGSTARGIRGGYRLNTTIRHCTIRGFLHGIELYGSESESGGHIIEYNRLDNNLHVGIVVTGDGSVIQNNRVVDTGGSPYTYPAAIKSRGQVDIIANTISGVTSDGAPDYSNTFGISTNYGTSNVSGNRISGLVAGSSGSVLAIYHSNANKIILTGNHLFGNGSGSGLNCGNSNDFWAKDNIVLGFSNGIGACGDGGGNVDAP